MKTLVIIDEGDGGYYYSAKSGKGIECLRRYWRDHEGNEEELTDLKKEGEIEELSDGIDLENPLEGPFARAVVIHSPQ